MPSSDNPPPTATPPTDAVAPSAAPSSADAVPSDAPSSDTALPSAVPSPDDAVPSAAPSSAAASSKPDGYLYYRHTLPVRVMHWINVIALTILLMSGLNIFNAHPALYWGSGSDFDHPIVMLGALQNNAGETTTGITSIGS